MNSPFGKHSECKAPQCKDGVVKTATFGARDCNVCESLRRRDMTKARQPFGAGPAVAMLYRPVKHAGLPL